MADKNRKPAKKRKIPRRNPTLSHIFTLAIIISACVMIYSGYRLVTTLWQYREGEKEYTNLRQYTSEAVQEEEPEEEEPEEPEETEASPADSSAEEEPSEEEKEREKETEKSGEEEAEKKADPEKKKEPEKKDYRTKEKPPIKVDFDSLREINEDVVGWLYIGSLDVSYPVVQGEDDDYYLHRTFEQNYNFSGSIFVEYLNKGDFSDPNTIVYGHNMQNGSMFGYLLRLTAEDLYKEDPYFWILTPEGNYKYAMFSIHETAISSDVYTIFGGRGENFVKWAEDMQKMSEASLPARTFSEDSLIVTLSTCTNDSTARYVVQGVAVTDKNKNQVKKAEKSTN